MASKDDRQYQYTAEGTQECLDEFEEEMRNGDYSRALKWMNAVINRLGSRLEKVI